MGWLPLSFGAPMVLAGLIALPAIWWLLRLTPPKPQTEMFPPLRILASVLRKEETPHKSPWWLTLLRLLMAALIIFALANPVLNPRAEITSSGDALAIVIDNGWSSAPDWQQRVETAERLIADAGNTGKPVVLAMTADLPNAEIGPFDAETALGHLLAAEAQPVPVQRAETYGRVAAALAGFENPAVAVLSDGIATAQDEAAFNALLGGQRANLTWAMPDRVEALGLTAADNEIDAFQLTAIRAPGDVAPRSVTAGAFDDRGRRIGDATIVFAAGSTSGEGSVNVPFELRNDFSTVAIDGQAQAGAVRVLDESAKRRRVGLISQAEADQAQPLLSPLFYIRKAMEPFADLVEPQNTDLAQAIPQILDQRPAMIVMADVGTIPDEARTRLVEWVEGGGTLVRFAGSRLSAAGEDEQLLPVRLRTGERALGGALSWTEPQPVTEFPQTGPFADLAPPSDVTVTRQVLAEPSADIVERTWANLADGTPLITGARRGQGTVVLFHVTPEATWSNLPISGSFVEMLRRVVQLSRNQGSLDASAQAAQGGLAPYRMIGTDGALVPPPPEARPLAAGQAALTIENPPGFYGGEEGVVAHNLLAGDAVLDPIARPEVDIPVAEVSYASDQSVDLRGPLFAAALLLMVLDTLVVLFMGGAFARRVRRRTAAVTTAIAVLMLVGGVPVDQVHAQETTPPAQTTDQRADDQAAIDAISTTRIAYVVTGDSSVDAITRAGIEGLTRYLIEKTALEPGEPAGVDIASDELSFYPIIYWPIDPTAAMPDAAAIARIDAYMQGGGTVLFDTRDQYSTGFDAGAASPETDRLREILADLNVPALEPVPSDHVLTKAFFITPEFPGRFAGSPLWVEASAAAENAEDRPVRTGDGVSPIMITANDLAGAWAIDASGSPMLPTVPADPMQREYALRGGVNIMMYMLTGNYKSDQVHVPSLLERLGQ